VAEAVILFVLACLCLILVVDIVRKDGLTEIKTWVQERKAALTAALMDLIPDVGHFPT
jgi:hypothetical protein